MIDISKGRIISSHGYVKLLMPEHPSADSKGYVYEHRVAMEKKIGRPLLSSEIVHHIDHSKQNNNPDNLEIVTGNGEHYLKHRKRNDLRRPGELNFIVKCLCGCGRDFMRYDQTGRPRSYISGHNVTHSKLNGRFEVRA